MKKSFKLIAVILIVLQLSMLCGSCYAKTASKVSSTQNNLFKSLVIPQFNMSIDEWMSTAEDRAYFTIAIAAELHNYLASGFDGPAAFHNPSFIGRAKHLIAVYLNDNAHQVFLMYNSLNDEITISYLDGIKEAQVPGVFRRNCSEYYRNETDVILRLALDESYSTSGIGREVFSTQEVYSFKSRLVPSCNVSVNEWMSSPQQRALFTIGMALDLSSHLGDDFDMAKAIITNASYIGRDALDIYLYLDDGTHQFLLFYKDFEDEVSYTYIDGVDEHQVILFFDEEFSEYYENEEDVRAEVAIGLSAMMKK